METTNPSLRTIWSSLGENSPRALTRIVASLIAGLLLAAAACVGVWLYAYLIGHRVEFLINNLGPNLVHVPKEEMGVALLLAGLAWLAALWIIWRRIRHVRPILAPVFITLGVWCIPPLGMMLAHAAQLHRPAEHAIGGIAAGVAALTTIIVWAVFLRGLDAPGARFPIGAVVARVVVSALPKLVALGAVLWLKRYLPPGEDQFLTVAAFLVAAAVVLMIWMPVVFRFERHAVIDREDHVSIHCPGCGYSLIGLRELRCPECGTTFVLDELIRAQGYSRPADMVESNI